jgi:DNA alkylation damage repair protein AlkB
MNREIIKEGVILYRNFLSPETQRKLVEELREVKSQAPFIRFAFKGSSFNNLNTSCGELGWVVENDEYKYVDKHPLTGNPWPPFTPTIAAIASQFKNGQTLEGKEEIVNFQSCLINLYEDQQGRESKLGLHQDKTESYQMDIVNVSLGDDAIFVLAGLLRNDPTQEIILRSGDILVMRSKGRMCFHGIRKLIPNTSQLLKSPGQGLGIRISLTLRQVYFVENNDGGNRNKVPPEQKPPENKIPLFLPHVDIPMPTMPASPESTKVNEDMTTPKPLPQEPTKPVDPTKRTIFENTIFTDSSGDIQTLTTWPIWDCAGNNGKWNNNKAPVVLRNVLLTALHPTVPMCIGEINKDLALGAIAKGKDMAWLLNPFTPQDEKGNTYGLDMASGSRNHGRFTFSTGIINPETKQPNGIGKFYYMTNPEDRWKRIIYGSILHTGCRQIRYETIKYIIVNDELKDEFGNFRDDPTNNRHWHSGDSHMKGSKKLFDLVGLNADPDAPDGAEVVDTERPFQIRIACHLKWVAKGTIAYNKKLDHSEWDLVIPLSSLKGNKPELGNYEDKLVMGVVHEAEERFAKPGWMLWQWFSFEDLEKDGIISRLEKKMQQLKDVSSSMPKLSEFMRREIEEYEAEVEGREELQTEAEYEDIFLDIVKNDTRGILLLHPYFVWKITDHLQNMWKTYCTAAGVRFYSVMTMPDESLAHYHVVHPDGRITGRKVFCAPDFKEGEYIVFCNPMRHWGDVQVWENRHEGAFKHAVGVMAVPTKLALTLGRDFDGDFVQLISTQKYPNITAKIKAFQTPPNTVKFPKIALSGSLAEIALGSMSDKTGIVASLIAQCKSLKLEQNVITIPPDGYSQSKEESMTMIDFLSQQLQIAVDSLKSAYPNNDKGLDRVRDYIQLVGDLVYDTKDNVAPWLKSLKQKATFVSQPCDVLADAPDTISRLVRLVNSYWQEFAIKYENLSPKDYQHALFFGVKSDPIQDNLATAHTEWYREHMGNAITECNKLAEKGIYTNEPIRVINTRVREYRKKIEENPKYKDFTMESWAAAYWRAANRRIEGRGTMVFTMFHKEIIEQLKNYGDNIDDHIIVFNVNKNEFAHTTYKWTGEKVTIQIREVEDKKHKYEVWIQLDKATRLVGFHCLGKVAQKYIARVRQRQTSAMKVFTTKIGRKGTADKSTHEVALIDLDVDDTRIGQILYDNRRKIEDKDYNPYDPY